MSDHDQDMGVAVGEAAERFEDFRNAMAVFRRAAGLPPFIDNPYEACTSLADKAGRLCRQVKHAERHDPKPGFPQCMAEDVVGAIVYAMMLADRYGVDLTQGVKDELGKAAGQHGRAK